VRVTNKKKSKKTTKKKSAKKASAKKVGAKKAATAETAPCPVCETGHSLAGRKLHQRFTCRMCLTLLQVTSLDPPTVALAGD
jgi:hypothetical protein